MSPGLGGYGGLRSTIPVEAVVPKLAYCLLTFRRCALAEIDVVRCAECGLNITPQDGHYHLVDCHYHPECYDRKQAASTPRTIWPRPPRSAPLVFEAK